MTPGLPLLLALLGTAHGGTATLEGSTLRALIARPEVVEPQAPAPWASAREVSLVPVEGGIAVRATWTLRAVKPGFFVGQLIGPGAHVTDVRWNGAPAGASTTTSGTSLAGWVEDEATVSLEAFVPGEVVDLLPAVHGTVRLDGPLDLGADGALALQDGDVWRTAAARLSRVQAPPNADAGPLVLAEAGLGLTVGDAEVLGRAHVAWTARRGSIEGVSLIASGVGDDLEVTGSNVASWRRSGDRVEVTLREPAERVDLDLSWSRATPPGTEGSLTVPRVQPLDAFRTHTTLQIAREEELEVVPDLPGWQAVASSKLPEWARGLVLGAVSATFEASGSPTGRLDLLRFVPVSLPPVMVDVAEHRVALTAEGRVLARGFYEVRNERAPWLRIQPPEGWQILGVRVSGDTARPVTDGQPGWLVPLPRSVETVEGLISFSVEVAFLGQEAPMADRGERAVLLPVLDAEIADWRTTVFLPSGYRSRQKPGEGGAVAEFAQGEGVTYGLSLGDGYRSAQADALFEDALTSWLSNDFESAQQSLDDLRAMGADGGNVELLQSNLDLMSGDRSGKDYTSRRIRSQASARAGGAAVEQQELERKADESRRSGDLKKAKEYYEQAIEIGDTLATLEGEETVEASSRNSAYWSVVEEIDEELDVREQAFGDEEDQDELPWDTTGGVAWDTEGPVEWDVDGEPEWMDSVDVDGVEGGAIGGSLGGGYGAAGGSAGITMDSLQSMPASARDYESAMLLSDSESRKGRRSAGRGRGRGGGRRTSKKSEVRVGSGSYDQGDDFGTPMASVVTGYAEAPLEVEASALSVTVPAVGQAVRYQRLLVPAGQAQPISIEAQISAKERRNR